MEQQKGIPGTKPFRVQIVELKTELGKLDGQIGDYKKKIEAIKKNDANNSPMAPLIAKLKELTQDLSDLTSSKKECYDKINSLNETHGDFLKTPIEPKGSITTESIEKRLKNINLDMLKYPCNAQKSKSYEDEIKDLKLKKINLEAEKKKHEALRQAQEEYKLLKAKLSEIYAKMDKKKADINEVKESMKGIKTEKNPVIVGYEKIICDLEAKKEEINKKIALNQAEIAKKKVDYDEYLNKKSIAEAYEKRRIEICDKIREMETRKENMEDEKDKCDASKYDSVIFFLEKKTGKSDERITFPIDIVMSLSQFKVTIPSTVGQISETISQLNKKKMIFLETVVIRKGELKSEIEKIVEEISKEKALLAELPISEIKLPRLQTKPGSN